MSKKDEETSGYSPAAQPVMNNVVHTDLTGIVGRQATLRSGDLDMPVYHAWPEGGPENRPVVIVLSEAFGLHEHIKDIVRRFAKEGYVAIAPELMIRQGDPMAYDDVGALVREVLVKIPDGQVIADIDACYDWARREGADMNRASMTGFCWGGRWTWLYATHRRLASAVAWYGVVDGRSSGMFPEDADLFPAHPIELVDRLQAPVLGLYGGRDEAIPLDTIVHMRDLLENGDEAARRSRIHIYPDAGHAFFADYRGSYSPAVAQDAWRRCLEWIADRNAEVG